MCNARRLRDAWVALLLAAALATGATTARALSIVGPSGWDVQGDGTTAVVEYCESFDCRSLRIACVGYGVPALAYATGLAMQRPMPTDGGLTVTVDGVPYFVQTTRGFLDEFGIVPQFQISPGDPLVRALSSGYEATLVMGERIFVVPLDGSREAIETFGRECGWDGYQGFASIEERAAAERTQIALAGGPRLSLYRPERPSRLVLSCVDYPPLDGRQISVDRREADAGRVTVQFPPFRDRERSFQPPAMSALTQFGDTLTDRDAILGGYGSDWELRVEDMPDGTAWTMMVPDYGEFTCITQ